MHIHARYKRIGLGFVTCSVAYITSLMEELEEGNHALTLKKKEE